MNHDVEWLQRTPDLVADVRLYATTEGGRHFPAPAGWGCPCFASRDSTQAGWDARLQIGDGPIEPGTCRRVGFVFLTPEGSAAMKQAGHFFLWEGGFVGEARVVG